MASKPLPPPSLFLLSLNLVFFTLVSSTSRLLSPSPSPTPAPSPSSCNPISLAVCARVLGLVSLNVTIPTNPGTPCCNLINGLGATAIEVSTCFCRTLRINLLNVTSTGFNLTPVGFNNLTTIRFGFTTRALLSSCGRQLPGNFTCPS